MNRKAFTTWGLLIISILPTYIAAIQYLGISKLIDINNAAVLSAFLALIVSPFLFGTILHMRFKEIGRRKRIFALCIFLYLFTLTMTGPSMLYNEHIIANSGAEKRFFGAISEWAKTHDPDTPMVWTQKQILDYVLITIPTNYISQWGLFALLWFGSLDPRTPSKNGFIRFMKHGFQRTSGGHIKTESGQLIQV